MEEFPVLKTKRLLLRKLRHTDALDLYNYFSDPNYAKYSGSECFSEVEQAEDLIRIVNERLDSYKGIKWGITMRGEDRIIGTCGFENRHKNDFKAEIGFGLSPNYWQKGIMTESLNEVIKFGYKKLELNRIEAIIYPENFSSRKLLEKCGFKEEGYLRDYHYTKDGFLDMVIFSLLKNQFPME
ncbi:GNAT family N-acetyltransferase [Guptibacillus hwajinpoensis]|uniref:GNAT family N-acetyltransferase n=1 Tax=Guptibacillus hwajinpoensis TaxID=208199 RepID=UPI003D067F9F